MPTQASVAASPTAAGGERGEAGKRKNDCDTQPDTERSVSIREHVQKNCEASGLVNKKYEKKALSVAKVRARLGSRGRLSRYTVSPY